MRTFSAPGGETVTPGQPFIGTINGEEVLVSKDAWTYGLTFLESRGLTYVDDFSNETGDYTISELVALVKEYDRGISLVELDFVRASGFDYSGTEISFTDLDLETIARQKAFFDAEGLPSASDVLRFENGAEVSVTPANIDALLVAAFAESRQARQDHDDRLVAIEGVGTSENHRFQGDTEGDYEVLSTQLRGNLLFTLTTEGVPEGDESFELRIDGKAILAQTGLPNTSETAEVVVGQYNTLTVEYYCGGTGNNAEFYVLDIEVV